MFARDSAKVTFLFRYNAMLNFNTTWWIFIFIFHKYLFLYRDSETPVNVNGKRRKRSTGQQECVSNASCVSGQQTNKTLVCACNDGYTADNGKCNKGMINTYSTTRVVLNGHIDKIYIHLLSIFSPIKFYVILTWDSNKRLLDM